MTAGAATSPPTLIDQIADHANLERAWHTVLANDLDDGDLTRAVDAFASAASRRLADLHESLTTRTYRPSSLFAVQISDDDGDERELQIPTVTDRIVERAIAQVVMPLLDPQFTPWSFAYRTGLGVTDALQVLVDRRDQGAATSSVPISTTASVPSNDRASSSDSRSASQTT